MRTVLSVTVTTGSGDTIEHNRRVEEAKKAIEFESGVGAPYLEWEVTGQNP